MSAVIHPFPVATPDDGTHQPTTDDLVAELTRATGIPRSFVGTADGPAPLVEIRPDRRGGSNDLVTMTPMSADVRNRWLVLALATLAMGMVFAIFAGLGSARADGDLPVGGQVTLQSGQTLWEVADDVTPAGQDVRPTVDAIMRLNDFSSATLPAGTLVLLPQAE